MASDRHKQHLKQYMKSKKAGGDHGNPRTLGEKGYSGSQEASLDQSDDVDAASTSQHLSQLQLVPAGSSSRSGVGAKSKETHAAKGAVPKTYHVRSTRTHDLRLRRVDPARNSINSLPEEILQHVFSMLDAGDLMVCAQVCYYWHQLADDNALWEKQYKKYIGPPKKGQKEPVKPRDPSVAFWKQECIRRCFEGRLPKVYNLLKKVDPYTGLAANTDKALVTLGTMWHLVFVPHYGDSQSFTQRDVFNFRMAVTVRWYSLELPPLKSIKLLRVYAANPVFVNKNGQPRSSSICQTAALSEVDFNWSRIKSQIPIVAADDRVDVRILSPFLFATWKDGGELAFITASFHVHDLIRRCTTNIPRGLQPVQTDKQKSIGFNNAGLYGCNCTIELRNQRTSLWSDQFRSIYFDKEQKAAGSATLTLISSDQTFRHTPIPKKLNLPWKTDLFKNILMDVCILDITLMNDQHKAVWMVSSPVHVTSPEDTTVTYDYDGDYHFIDYSDWVGKLHMEMVWEEELGQNMITCLQLHLSLAAIGV